MSPHHLELDDDTELAVVREALTLAAAVKDAQGDTVFATMAKGLARRLRTTVETESPAPERFTATGGATYNTASNVGGDLYQTRNVYGGIYLGAKRGPL